MKKTLELQSRALLPYVFFVILLGILTFFGVSQAYSRFTQLQGQVSELSAQKQLFERKLLTLQELDRETLSFSEAAYLALPAYNPSLLVISQIKRQSKNFDVTLNDIRVGTGEDISQDLSSLQINFKVAGKYTSVVSFIKKLEEEAPIMNINNIKIEEVAPDFQATISLVSYWSALPDKLPALTELVVGFAQDELDTLSTLSKLEAPQFTQPEEGTSEPVVRPDPFAI